MTKIKKYQLTEELVKKARFLCLAGDETRIRILCLLFGEKEACVSEIAEALDMTLASISHHLRIMKDNGLVATEREGTSICYRVVENDITKKLAKIICE